jgi:hypothetical protein
MPPKQKAKQTEEEFFRGQVEKSILAQCEVRGIPEEEVDSVKAAIRERYGMGLEEMHYGYLKRCSRELPDIMVAYLDGEKRRPLPGQRLPAGFEG